ncbi:hypothetical protein QP028_08485 [Corynebacterium suedekumii]|nr:hypothetical protein QP028_08485 [Corynebacterium suedekumii]
MVTDVTVAVTTVTGPTAMAVLALLIAMVDYGRTRRWAVWLLPAAVLAANLASHLLKALIGRERPPEVYRLIVETSPAFPSVTPPGWRRWRRCSPCGGGRDTAGESPVCGWARGSSASRACTWASTG